MIAVVHVHDKKQAIENVAIAMRGGLHGVFLINHDMSSAELLTIFRRVRDQYPHTWIGINTQDLRPAEAFEHIGVLKQQGCRVDGLWTDNPEIDGVNPGFANQDHIRKIQEKIEWDGLYFGGVAFKYQEPPSDLASAVRTSRHYLDVITTSGAGTGKAIDEEKIRNFRENAENHPIAIASGVSADNIKTLARYADVFLTASSLNKEGDFYNFDPTKVEEMGRILEEING